MLLSKTFSKGGFFDDMFRSFFSSEDDARDDNDDLEGGKFVPLDYESSGSLTGEGDGTFGPLAGRL